MAYIFLAFLVKINYTRMKIIICSRFKEMP